MSLFIGIRRTQCSPGIKLLPLHRFYGGITRTLYQPHVLVVASSVSRCPRYFIRHRLLVVLIYVGRLRVASVPCRRNYVVRLDFAVNYLLAVNRFVSSIGAALKIAASVRAL